MSKIEHRFNEQYELVEMLSKSIAADLKDAIREKGKATLLVSGGSTPKPLFKRLSEMTLEWENVTVGLCDERWLPVSDESSNENLVTTHLLQGKAANATFVGMYVEETDIESAEHLCDKKLRERLLPFDVIVLGMGSDAHTASLFPNNVKLDKAFDLKREALCIAIEPQTAPYMRMSLTRHAILSAARIYLHFEGNEKIAVYKEVKAGDDMFAMPIRAILNQDIKDVEVYYI
ncbi:MAG: 6-phosphogluconolactonase [Campylobacterota bacterium]|nr:6-phosphogluconolactonase [Campylobacterota bacterium]